MNIAVDRTGSVALRASMPQKRVHASFASTALVGAAVAGAPWPSPPNATGGNAVLADPDLPPVQVEK